MGSIFFGFVVVIIAWFLVRHLIEFAKAAAMRPQIVGLALKKTSQDPDISRALFNVLETQNIIAGEANITLIPKNANLLGELVAATQAPKAAAVK
jgi:hypothetical protein